MKKLLNLILIFIFMLTIDVNAIVSDGFYLGDEECFEGTVCEYNGTNGKLSYDGKHTITVDNYTGLGIEIDKFNNDLDIVIKGENEFLDYFIEYYANSNVNINGEKNSKIIASDIYEFININSENGNSDLNINNVEIISTKYIIFNEYSNYNTYYWAVGNNGINPEINNSLANGNGKVTRLNNEKKIGNFNIKNSNINIPGLFYGVGNITIENCDIHVSPIDNESFIENPIGDEVGFIKVIDTTINVDNDLSTCYEVFYCGDIELYINNSTIEGFGESFADVESIYIEDSNISFYVSEYFMDAWEEVGILNSTFTAIGDDGEEDFLYRCGNIYFYDSNIDLYNFDNITNYGTVTIDNSYIKGVKIQVFFAGDTNLTVRKSTIETQVVCGLTYSYYDTGEMLFEESTIIITSPTGGTQDGFVIKNSEAVFKNCDIVMNLNLESKYTFKNGFSIYDSSVTFENTYISINSYYAFHTHQTEPGLIKFIGDYQPVNSSFYEVYDGTSYAGYIVTQEYTSNIANQVKLIQTVLVDKENYSYEIEEGNNQELTINNISDYSFKIDGNHLLLDTVMFNDIELERDVDYKVYRGSTIITLTNTGINKVNTSGTGKKEINVIYTNGNEVKVELLLADVKNPKTGDNLLISILLLIISSIMIIIINKKYLHVYSK